MLALLCAVTGLTALQSEFQVLGLREGESAVTLPRVAQEDSWVSGRAVDAFLGTPVSGATIETWTEETTSATSGFQRIGVATSADTGQFSVLRASAGVPSEKVLVRADGYLPLATVVSDLDTALLFPEPQTRVALRVVDFNGRPIEGAVLTSTYSCAHDVSPFEHVTDASGRVVVEGYGLQENIGQLRILAAGYAGIEYASWDQVATAATDTAGSARPERVFALARRHATAAATILDAQGRPRANCALRIVDGEGEHVLETDAEGRLALGARYDGAEFVVFALGEERETYVYNGALPPATPVAIRSGAPPWPEALTGRLSIRSQATPEAPVTVNVFHEDGWTLWKALEGPDELLVPGGQLLLLCGERFGGWSPRELSVTVAPGSHATVELDLIPEPEVEVSFLASPPRELRIESATDSWTERVQNGVANFTAPAERLILADVITGRQYAELPASEEKRTVALASGNPARTDPLPRSALDVTVRGADGSPLAGSLGLRGRGSPESEQISPGRFRVEADRGEELLITFRAKGFAHTGARALAGTDTRIELRPLPLARLAIDAALPVEVLAPAGSELNALHPGPVRLELALGEETRVVLELELQPGESRRLELRTVPSPAEPARGER